MASRAALLLVRATPLQFSFKPKKALIFNRNYAIKSSLELPDVQRLAETARISLSPHEVEEFAPKIQQVIDWYLDLERATCWIDLYHNTNSKASIDVNHEIIGIKEIFSYLMVSASIKFGQLQAVDLQNVEPAIRADNEGETLREDSPEIFENRDAILAAVPSYEDSYIRVPKVLNKE